MATIPNGFSVPMIKYPILSTLGMLNTHNYGEYLKNYPDLVKDSYIMKTEASGALKYTPTKKFKQWNDDNRPLPSFKVTGNVTGASAGSAVTVTLTSGSHTGSGKLSPVAVGQVWENDADGVMYEVRSVTKSSDGAHQASIAPVSNSVTASITASSAFFKYHGRPSVKEASVQQDGIYQSWGSRERDLQIIRTNKAYSDLAKFELLEVNNQSYYNIDRTNLDKEHIMTQELRLMFGSQMNNLTDSAGNMNTDAEGMIPQILRWGTDLTSTTSLSDAFFEDLLRANDADGYTNKYDVLAETEFVIAYQNYLRNATSATNVSINLTPSEKEIQAVFDFTDNVKIYGQEITLKNYAYLNSSRTHGADLSTGFWAGSAIFIPQGTAPIASAEADLPYFRVRYMSDSEGGTINHFDTDGGLVGKNTNRDVELALTSYKGLEMYNMRAFKYAKIS